MCAVKFLRLEDFLTDQRHGLAIELEPKGLLFAEVCIHMVIFAVHLVQPLQFILFANKFQSIVNCKGPSCVLLNFLVTRFYLSKKHFAGYS
jgi:hypothetical protein